MPLTVHDVKGIRPEPRRCGGPAAILVLVLAVTGLTAGSAPAATLRVKLDSGEIAGLSDGRELFLEAPPRRGEGLLSFARRYCGSTGLADELVEANGGRKRLLVGVHYRVPYSLLSADFQLKTLWALFDTDEVLPGGWRHRIGSGLHGRESLWLVAEWFTGTSR